MKTAITILLLFITIVVNAQLWDGELHFGTNTTGTFSTGQSGVTYNLGVYNIYIGEGIGWYNTGSYNIIISDKSEYTNIQGSFIFYVDYDCKWLKDKPEMITFLKTVEPIFKKKWYSYNTRIEAIKNVQEAIKLYL